MTESPRNPPRDEEELVELLRSVDVSAPKALHAGVQAMVAERQSDHTTLRGALSGMRLRLGALAAAGAVAGATLALALGGPGSSALSLGEAAAITLRPATSPAPTESASDRATLNAGVEGIAFPYWEDTFGWRSTGSRTTHVAGRTVHTVFYEDRAGHRVGYSIVAGTPAPKMPADAVHWRNGTAYHLSNVGGAQVVTWERNGHLCVIAGRDVPSERLLTLASWDNAGA
jgi:hypothetical protein